VRPEPNSGADGVFAAFGRNGAVTLVSFACAWGEPTVSEAKASDQKAKVNLQNGQFGSARDGVLLARKKELEELLNTARNVSFVKVLVELPRRSGKLPNQNIDAGCFVIDERNVLHVLGFSAQVEVAQESANKKTKTRK
jgi:hypothetical protein